jgi:eukaryotic-like serine/threonine-protein kinase
MITESSVHDGLRPAHRREPTSRFHRGTRAGTLAAVASRSAEPGAVFAGRYRLIRELGRGGMGAVWLAEHLTLRSNVAIKVIDPTRVASPSAVGRFVREAQAAAALHSPHVVHVFDFGDDEGVPYIAMELLDGESLAQRLQRVGKLSPAETCEIVTQIARALAKAHHAGVIHRDLKPDNLFLVRNDDATLVKVLDFGIAKAVSGELEAAAPETETGAILGTPYYMSPEQIEGSKDIDHRSDLWSLALITYECLLGSRPFEGSKLGELILQICVRPMPVPSERGAVPEGFDAWFARAAAREQNARFATARELAEALRTLVRGMPSRVVVTPVGEADPFERTQQATDSVALGGASPPALTTGRAVVGRSRPTRRTRSAALLAGLGGATVVAAGLSLVGLNATRSSQEDLGKDVARDAENAGDVAASSGDAASPALVVSVPSGPARSDPDAAGDARTEKTERDAAAPAAVPTVMPRPPRIDWGLE